MNNTTTKDRLLFAGLFALALVLGIVSDRKEQPKTAEDFEPSPFVEVMVAEEGTGVKLIRSDEWAEQYPDQYATYIMNDENSEVVDYIAENPYIKTLYEGFGFAVSYGSARGHTYVIEDLTETGRPHKLANCFTCKTSSFTEAVLNDGVSAYAMAFEDMEAQVTDAFGCFHCHANEPGVLYVTHPYVAAALGDDLTKVNAANLTCAQCHTEYYFDPATKETTVTYHGLSQFSPDDSLAYQNTLLDAEGNLFCDWVDADTGVRKLKVQHPEFETYMGEGSVHASQFTCADCHMGKTTAEDGTVFTNHYWVSPLDSPEIMANSCSLCHQDLEGQVRAIQTATRERENEIGYALEQLDKDLAAAIEAGTISDEDLENARMAYRNAQFFWDYVFVENSEGAHNSRLTNHCLDKAQEYLDEANACIH
ncbi:MAG: ammonia-forming cytochrome c nitrite reductase subunit c552 [Solobacterium sp.]|nr:ammonia-forming cytochrome c nitrite reductase subunit c552 [Solobacterium sp.]